MTFFPRTYVLTRIVIVGITAAFSITPEKIGAAESAKKIVLIAGKKSHGPVGNGIHDYPWSVKLLKVMLDNSNVADRVRVEYHLDGWVEDESTLDDADAIMVISDGRDGDAYAEAPQFATEEHRTAIAKQIARGSGFLTFHFSTFAPDEYAEDILSWSGGYFDWETDGKKQWYSAIKTLDAEVELGTPEHPVLRGVEPFQMREEFYYNIRFAADDASLKPLLVVPAVEGRAENGDVVAWAKERPDGGRGFGTTCGHFYDNWRNAAFRKFILNAIVWAAHGDVPPKGVEAKYYTHEEITGALSGKQGTERAVVDGRPIKALILTGHQYPGHLWKDTTPAIQEALSADPRIQVDVSETIEDLATDKLAGYDLLVLNYCNWEKPGLSDAAKTGFVKYLSDGGGLIIVHFANGAFHFSLPKAGESDWPEYRKICRRVWDHTENKSGHDAYGKFIVDIAKADHPITRGMEPFETIDELYFRQQGEEPIDVLLTAKSKITGRDEPMAFVYHYGQGRVMQTVLGHAAESLRVPQVAQLLRRSAAWVAQRDQPLASSQPANSPAKKKPSDNAFYHWSKDVVGFDWTEQDSVDNRWSQADVGPFLASIVPMPGQPPVAKALSIKVGDNASVCYDTQTMALRSAWTGGFLKFNPARYGIIAPPMMDGESQFLSSPDAGWQAKSVNFRGFRPHERQLVLETEVDGVRIRELPQFVERNRQSAFIRMLQIDPGMTDLRLRLGRFSDVNPPKLIGSWKVVSWKSQARQYFAAVGDRNGVGWSVEDGDVQLVIPARSHVVTPALWLFTSTEMPEDFLPQTPPDDPRITLIDRLSNSGKSLWSTDLITQGTLGVESGPYQVDTLTIPFENPYHALFFITGHDFFSNGDMAVCTVHGDVWRVSGIDADLKELRWRRYATGLFQPLGLKIAEDVVCVLGRDRITKLHDDNADGFADRYENFCDLYETSPSGHDYITCLETDPEGDFYFVHAKHGVQKVSKGGTKLETVATGLRNPNGLSVSPTGEITAAPQEGEWTPASAIFMVHKGDHFGYGGPKITPQRPLGYDPPLCWIPRLTDNSSGGQCWTPDASFGLPAGSLLHFSFGQCRALLALRESYDNNWQGGVISLPWRFQSGLSRGRFSPHDGCLYVSGLKGWTTSAVQDGCLQRVRYVVGDVPWPVKMESYRNGIAFTFGCRLDKVSAEDPENYDVQACNYRYSQAYGSADYHPSHPTVEGRDDWDVASVTLFEDQKTVFLDIPDLTPVMQVIVNWSIMSADQAALANSYNGTIHHLPERVFDVPESSRKPRPGRLTREQEAALVPGVLLTFQQRDRVAIHPARMLACEFAANQPPATHFENGPYEIHAEGYVKTPLSGAYQFRFEGTATGKLRINDEPVAESTAVRLHKGYNRVSLTAASVGTGQTSLRLMWQAGTFAEEPVPPTAWFHDGQSEIARTADRRRRGRELFETFHCANCHQSPPADGNLAPVFHAPSLQELSGRVSKRWISAWLLDPRSIRRDAEMPALFDAKNPSDRQAAADVAAYLLKDGEIASERRELPGDIESGGVLHEELGCIACHRFTAPSEDDAWNRSSLHFTAEKFPGDSLAGYLRQPQRHHRFSRMPDFQLTESEADSLADYLLLNSTGRLDQPPELAQADAVRGRKLFSDLRCGQCHGPQEKTDAPRERIAFPQNGESWNRGCLEDRPSPDSKSPWFPIDEDDRTALREFLFRASDGAPPMTPIERSRYFVERLNCTACHHRDHVVSPLGEIVSEESERGLPAPALPNLTFAGEKLHADWMRRLFRGELPHKTRPWLTARMPAFPAYADELAAGLAAEHGYGTEVGSIARLNGNPEIVEIGRRLTLKDNGLDCRQCHAVAGQQPTGDDKTKIAPGIDFADTKQRLRADFYRRFVLDPPRFDVTIRMPKLAIDGKTTQAVNVFDGDASRQFEALWQYIQLLPDSKNTN